jgi:hypothetical protein
MLGSDSHTPAAGAIGMLAIGAGCLEVAMAIAGEPFYVGIAIDLGDQTRGNASRLGISQRRRGNRSLDRRLLAVP